MGAPTVTLTLSSLGTSRNTYAQLVDNSTGRALGNLVTPIMENIAYAMSDPTDWPTLQVVDSATAYEDFTSFGVAHVRGVGIVLPLPPSESTGTATVVDLLTGAANR